MRRGTRRKDGLIFRKKKGEGFLRDNGEEARTTSNRQDQDNTIVRQNRAGKEEQQQLDNLTREG